MSAQSAPAGGDVQALSSWRADLAALHADWSARGLYRDTTIATAIAQGCARHPDTRLIFSSGGMIAETSAGTLYAQARGLAAALAARGYGAGDVIAVQLPSWHEAAVIYAAIAELGAITLPIVTIYGPAELTYILEQAGARLLFVPGHWRNREFGFPATAQAGLPRLREVIAIRAVDDEPTGAWAALLDEAQSADRLAVPTAGMQADPNGIALIMFTSGTTSRPKGVQHTHNTLLHEWDRPIYRDQGIYLSTLPAGHYSGYSYILRPLIYGTSTVFIDQWLPERAAELIERYRVRCSGGTPVFLLTLLEAARSSGRDVSSLTTFSLGGQGMGPDLIAAADAAGFAGCRIYGLTEHPTVTALDGTAPFAKRAHTDGRLEDGNEIRIVDEDGKDVAPGMPGEVWTRGPEMFVGYLDPDQNAACFAPGGWFRTGDIGRIDDDGYLTITDRKKDIIIRGGENISSIEVEEALLRHPAIAEAAAVAAPHPRFGECVCAFVVLRPGAALSIADLQAHFQAMGLAIQKTPERLEIVPALPRNALGKVLKAELRNQIKQNR